MSLSARDRIIVALDTDEPGAYALADALQGSVRWLKVGMTLFYQAGPGVVLALRERGFDVFLDLKLHDIPHQVRGAAASVGRLGVQMLTVHASGGAPMVAAAVEGAAEGAAAAGLPAPAVIGVTVLTSMDDEVLRSVGVERSAAEQVPLLGGVVREAKAAGCVCSPQEAHVMRELLGPEALVVTPGVRPAGADAGDQSRVATPASAIASGATHLVIGRPVTEAVDPREEVDNIVSEMEGIDA